MENPNPTAILILEKILDFRLATGAWPHRGRMEVEAFRDGLKIAGEIEELIGSYIEPQSARHDDDPQLVLRIPGLAVTERGVPYAELSVEFARRSAERMVEARASVLEVGRDDAAKLIGNDLDGELAQEVLRRDHGSSYSPSTGDWSTTFRADAFRYLSVKTLEEYDSARSRYPHPSIEPTEEHHHLLREAYEYWLREGVWPEAWSLAFEGSADELAEDDADASQPRLERIRDRVIAAMTMPGSLGDHLSALHPESRLRVEWNGLLAIRPATNDLFKDIVKLIGGVQSSWVKVGGQDAVDLERAAADAGIDPGRAGRAAEALNSSPLDFPLRIRKGDAYEFRPMSGFLDLNILSVEELLAHENRRISFNMDMLVASMNGEPKVEARESAGEYEFLERIGRGAHAEVWLAREREPSREVAIKLVDTDQIDVVAHAQALVDASHPNVVVVHRIVELSHPETGLAQRAIVMEHLVGDDLDEFLVRLVSADVGHTLGRQLLAALSHFEHLGLVHGDLQAPNIRVLPNILLKVIDLLHTNRTKGISQDDQEGRSRQDRRNAARLLNEIVTHSDCDIGSAAQAMQPALRESDPSLHLLRRAFDEAFGHSESVEADLGSGGGVEPLSDEAVQKVEEGPWRQVSDRELLARAEGLVQLRGGDYGWEVALEAVFCEVGLRLTPDWKRHTEILEVLFRTQWDLAQPRRREQWPVPRTRPGPGDWSGDGNEWLASCWSWSLNLPQLMAPEGSLNWLFPGWGTPRWEDIENVTWGSLHPGSDTKWEDTEESFKRLVQMARSVVPRVHGRTVEEPRQAFLAPAFVADATSSGRPAPPWAIKWSSGAKWRGGALVATLEAMGDSVAELRRLWRAALSDAADGKAVLYALHGRGDNDAILDALDLETILISLGEDLQTSPGKVINAAPAHLAKPLLEWVVTNLEDPINLLAGDFSFPFAFMQHPWQELTARELLDMVRLPGGHLLQQVLWNRHPEATAEALLEDLRKDGELARHIVAGSPLSLLPGMVTALEENPSLVPTDWVTLLLKELKYQGGELAERADRLLRSYGRS